MKTLSIKVPEELAARIEKQAKLLGISVPTLIRQSIEKKIRHQPSTEETISAYDLMRKGLGCVDSRTGDLSTTPGHLRDFGS